MHNGHYDYFMVTIIKDLLAFVDNCYYGDYYEGIFSFPIYMHRKPINEHHLCLVIESEKYNSLIPHQFFFILQH